MSRDSAIIADVQHVAELVSDVDAATFASDVKTQSAVLHQLLIIGEAVRRLPQEFRDAHLTGPGRLIVGMRNRLIHHYDAVDFQEVWNTATRDVPALMIQLASIIAQRRETTTG